MRSDPLTWTGLDRCSVVPSPSRPSEFAPQHQAAPAPVRPQTLSYPLDSALNFVVPETGTGTKRSTFVPFPSCPNWFVPQHQAEPPVTSTHVNPEPTATWVTAPIPLALTDSSSFGAAIDPVGDAFTEVTTETGIALVAAIAVAVAVTDIKLAGVPETTGVTLADAENVTATDGVASNPGFSGVGVGDID